MERLWAPWRMEYINGAKPAECVLCAATAREPDAENLVLYRGSRAFVIMNRYPYSNGHLMVAPLRHTADPDTLDDGEMLEMFQLVRLCRRVLKESFVPDGFNIGMNLGKVAGAGVEDHMHLHVVPRWLGDTSFMGVIDDVRVIPEALQDTWRKLLPRFAEREG